MVESEGRGFVLSRAVPIMFTPLEDVADELNRLLVGEQKLKTNAAAALLEVREISRDVGTTAGPVDLPSLPTLSTVFTPAANLL